MIILVVGNGVQAENAAAVARFLDPGSYRYLSLWTREVTADHPRFPSHTPPLRLRVVYALSRTRFAHDDLVVVPQDNGVLQRAVVAAARRSGAGVALLPDGVITRTRMHSQGGAHRRALDQLDMIGRGAGLVAGHPGVMGSTLPDLTLLWGLRWAEYLNRGGARGPTTAVGCPRMDALVDVPSAPDRSSVLICSQPLHVAPSWAVDAAPRWYARLTELFAQGSTDPRVRLRLHPREMQDDRVPTSLKAIASHNSMRADIAAADVVAAPFSTALLEAAACGRSVVTLPYDERFAERSQEFAFLAPAWVPAVRWQEVDADSLLGCENVSRRMTEDCLVNVGTASEVAAAVLRAR